MNDIVTPPKKASRLRAAYDWMILHAQKPGAFWSLGAVSFAESSFFPLPPDIMLLPMALANRKRAMWLAVWCTFTSVLGGMFGYAIGALFYDSVGQWIVGLFGSGDTVEKFRAGFAEYGMWIILVKGATPIPYKIVTILSGFAGYDFWAFVGLSVLTRFLRFGLIGALVYFYGDAIKAFIEKRLGLAMTVIFGGLIVGVGAIKFLF
jgi:membrane protein YqaA with SNARE-associated domain